MSIVAKIKLLNFRLISSFLIFAMISSLVVISSPKTTYAANCDQDFFAQNDILYYDGCAESSCSPGSGINVTLSGDDNEQKILNFFMQKGLNLAQASGFIGNMFQESGLRPDIIQGGATADENYTPQNGVGFGLVQWTFKERQGPLADFAKEMGVPVTDLGMQLEFVWKELNEGYSETLRILKTVDDPVDAAIVVHGATLKTVDHPKFSTLGLKVGYGYEASNDTADHVISVRGGKAQETFDKYKDAPALAGSESEGSSDENTTSSRTSSSNGCNSSSSGGGSLTELLMDYAYPTQDNNLTNRTPMPEYKKAVDEARKEGYYVGGTNYPGIDCGGFVTLLVRNSGFDEGYNFGGKIADNAGNTGQQEKWAKENWEYLGTSSEIDPAELQPGDVAINSGHTFIYVGEVEGFDSKIAAASLDTFAPLAHKYQSPTEPGYNWYRKKQS